MWGLTYKIWVMQSGSNFSIARLQCRPASVSPGETCLSAPGYRVYIGFWNARCGMCMKDQGC